MWAGRLSTRTTRTRRIWRSAVSRGCWTSWGRCCRRASRAAAVYCRTRELFQHVQEEQQLFRNLIREETLDLFFEKGQDYWARKLEAQLQALLPEGKTPKVPLVIVANHLAGAWLNILKWWLDNKMPYTSERMDEILQQLVMPGVWAVLGIEDGGSG